MVDIMTLQIFSWLFSCKILFTLFMAILVPVYWRAYGWQNFLWISDAGLFLTFFALWFESPLLISIAGVGVLPLELIWCVDFFVTLLLGCVPFGLANYMFDSHYALFLRGLSLFHVVTPLIWCWYMIKWGYDPQAVFYAPVLIGVLCIIAYLCTDPRENINWVFMPTIHQWHKISPLGWLVVLIVGLSLCMVLPMHYVLKITMESF